LLYIEKYIYFFKIKQIIGNNLNNPKGASFKENHLSGWFGLDYGV
jgi:hypothetical protein